jgi:hypothetical protein
MILKKKLITAPELLLYGFQQILDGKWFMQIGRHLVVQGYLNN